MRMKGFFLTTDSLLALVLLLAAAGTLAISVTVPPSGPGYNGMQALGRDYLKLKYWNGITFSDSFANLTGFDVNETAPQENKTVVVGASVRVSRSLYTSCGCLMSWCGLIYGINEDCLDTQYPAAATYKAWVTTQ